MCCINFKHIISKCHNIRNSLHFQLLSDFQKSTCFPFMVLPRQFPFKLGPCRHNLYVSSKYLKSIRQESLGWQLNPAIGSICNNHDLAIFFGQNQQFFDDKVYFMTFFEYFVWQRNTWRLDYQVLIRD
jgi:hypothetical protein